MRVSTTGYALGVLVLTSAAANAGEVYALDLRGTDRLVSFDATTPLVQTVIDADTLLSGYETFALDFDTAGNTLYMFNQFNTPTMELGSVSVSTGLYTAGPVITGFGIAAGDTASGLSVDPTNETFYLSSTVDLHTINPVTGVAVLVAPFSGMTPLGNPIGLIVDIAIDNSGNMYAHDISNDALWAIDKTTGVGTFVGSTNLAANFAQGMDFDPTDNQLYAAIYTGGGTGVYGTWDTTTGVVTTIEILPNIPDGSNEFELAIRAPTVVVNSGSAYCFGDGSGAGCPCGNVGGPGEGCSNSGGVGATLTGSGDGSFSNDTFQMDVAGVPGAKPGLIIRGNNQIANLAGDGLLCTGGGSMRSQVQITVAGATSFTNFQGAGFGSVANVGTPTNFQFWYRDPMGGPCGGGFNFSNGWTITYTP